MTSLAIRVPTADDADAIAARINAHAMAVRGEPNITGQVVREWLAEPSIDIRIVYDGDDPVCYGDMIVVPSGTRASLDIREHPAHPGATYMLLDAFEAAAVIRGATESRAYSDPAETAYVALLQARGYQAIRSSVEMLVRLADAPVAAPAPAGLEIRTRAAGQERPMYDASTDSFRDHWSFEPRTYDEWARAHIESATADASLQFLAWDGADVAGVCLCAPHQSARPASGGSTYSAFALRGAVEAWRLPCSRTLSRSSAGAASTASGSGSTARARPVRWSSTNGRGCVSTSSR